MPVVLSPTFPSHCDDVQTTGSVLTQAFSQERRRCLRLNRPKSNLRVEGLKICMRDAVAGRIPHVLLHRAKKGNPDVLTPHPFKNPHPAEDLHPLL